MPGPVPSTPSPSPLQPAAPSSSAARCVLLNRPGATVPSELINSVSKRIGRVVFCTDTYTAMAEICAAEHEGRAGGAQGTGGTVLLLVEPAQWMLGDLPELLAGLRLYAPGALIWKYASGANPRLSAVVESDAAAWSVAHADRTAVHGYAVAAGHAARSSPGPADTQRPISPLPDSSPSRAAAPPPRKAVPAATDPPRLRLAGASLPEPSGPVPSEPEIVVRPQPRGGVRSQGPSEPPSLTLRGQMEPEPAEGPARTRPVLTAEELRMLLGEDPTDQNGAASAGEGGR